MHTYKHVNNCQHPPTHTHTHTYKELYTCLFKFRVVLAQRLLKVKPFTSLPAMALLLRCFLIQIRITIKPVLTSAFISSSMLCRFEYFFAQSDSKLVHQ